MGQESNGGVLARQWSAAALAVGGFTLSGLSNLPGPPVLHPEHLLQWWGENPPVVAAMSLLRLGGLVCGIYWLVLCTSVIVFTRSGHLLQLTHLRLPGLRRLIRVATSGSLFGIAVVCAAGCAGTGGRPAAPAAKPPELLPLPQASPGGTPPVTPPLLEQAPAVPPPPTAAPTAPPPSTASPASPPVLPTTSAATTSTSWTVRPGEDLWSITESVLIARLGHRPDQAEVAALWLRVIDTNRPNLPDPANPSLIFTGDVITVPA